MAMEDGSLNASQPNFATCIGSRPGLKAHAQNSWFSAPKTPNFLFSDGFKTKSRLNCEYLQNETPYRQMDKKIFQLQRVPYISSKCGEL